MPEAPPAADFDRQRNPLLPAVLSLGMALLWWLAVVLMATRTDVPENLADPIWSLILLPNAACASAAVAVGRLKRVPPRLDSGSMGSRFANVAAALGMLLGAAAILVYAIGLSMDTS